MHSALDNFSRRMYNVNFSIDRRLGTSVLSIGKLTLKHNNIQLWPFYSVNMV